MNTLLLKSSNFSKWSMNALLKSKNNKEIKSIKEPMATSFNLEAKFNRDSRTNYQKSLETVEF